MRSIDRQVTPITCIVEDGAQQSETRSLLENISQFYFHHLSPRPSEPRGASLALEHWSIGRKILGHSLQFRQERHQHDRQGPKELPAVGRTRERGERSRCIW